MTKQLIAAVSIIGLLATTASCRSTAPALKTPQPAAAPVATPALPDSIRWVRDSAEYQAVVLQIYRAATTSVELAARGRQPASWAVVLDADETVINNVQYQIERALAWTEVHAGELALMGRAPRSHSHPWSRAFPLAHSRPRRPHRHRHEPHGVRVPGHRGGLQDAPPGIRRDPLPP